MDIAAFNEKAKVFSSHLPRVQHITLDEEGFKFWKREPRFMPTMNKWVGHHQMGGFIPEAGVINKLVSFSSYIMGRNGNVHTNNPIGVLGGPLTP